MPLHVDSLAIIIPVKDEEVGLRYLLEDFRQSSLFENPNVRLIFVIDERTSDSSKTIAGEFSEIIINSATIVLFSFFIDPFMSDPFTLLLL